MNQKLKLIICTVVIIVVVLLIPWTGKSSRPSFEIGDVELKQSELVLKSINTSFEEPIWAVQTESKRVCFDLVFRNEGEKSFHDTPGLINLVTEILLEGAGNRTSSEFKDILSDNSINISIEPLSDDIHICVSCLDRYFKLAVDLLCDVLSKAHLSKEKIEITKQNIIVAQKQSLFSPNQVAMESLNHTMFREGHPYRYSTKDIIGRMQSYTKSDVDNCYKKIFDPRNARIVIVSCLDEQTIRAGFNKMFNAINNVKSNDFSIGNQSTKFENYGMIDYVELDNAQSYIAFALPSVSSKSKERFALVLANLIFGEPGLVSRLSIATRDEHGLVYRIGTSVEDNDLLPCIFGGAATRPENVDDLIKKIKAECKRLAENGVTEEELNLFKTRIFSSELFDNNNAILKFVRMLRIRGVALSEVNTYLDNYRSVTLKEINTVVKKIFNPDKMIFSVCGKIIKTKEGNYNG